MPSSTRAPSAPATVPSVDDHRDPSLVKPRRPVRVPAASGPATIMTGPAASVPSSRRDGGVRSGRSNTTRVSGRGR